MRRGVWLQSSAPPSSTPTPRTLSLPLQCGGRLRRAGAVGYGQVAMRRALKPERPGRGVEGNGNCRKPEAPPTQAVLTVPQESGVRAGGASHAGAALEPPARPLSPLPSRGGRPFRLPHSPPATTLPPANLNRRRRSTNGLPTFFPGARKTPSTPQHKAMSTRPKPWRPSNDGSSCMHMLCMSPNRSPDATLILRTCPATPLHISTALVRYNERPYVLPVTA